MLDLLISASLNKHDSSVIASGVLMCVIAALSIALIVMVLLQRGSGDSVSAITGSSNSESFFSKTKGGGKQRKLRILTIAFAVAIAVLAVVFFIVAPLGTTAASA